MKERFRTNLMGLISRVLKLGSKLACYYSAYLISKDITSNGCTKLNQEEKAKDSCKLLKSKYQLNTNNH